MGAGGIGEVYRARDTKLRRGRGESRNRSRLGQDVRRLVCAHDCGLVINPEGPKARRIARHDLSGEGGMLHSLSRALHEEVRFDTEKVTSVDWRSHPSLTHADTPAAIDVFLVNGDPNPDRPICRPTEPAKRYANHWLRRSPTPSTTRLEFVFAGFRSETSACSRSSRPQACRRVWQISDADCGVKPCGRD